jgi:hypothetical protein
MLGRLAVTGRVCGVGPEHVGLGRSGVNFGPRAGATASPAVTRGGDITPGPLDDSKATSAPPRRCFRAGRDLPRHGWASLARRGDERGRLAFMPAAWHMMGSWASEKILLPSSSGGVVA